MPSVSLSVGCATLSIAKMLAVSVAFLTTLTFLVIVLIAGVVIDVPSNKISSPSSKSCVSSNKIPPAISSVFVPSSKDIPSLKVAVDSCSTRITFSNSVSRTFVFESNPLTVPT